MTRREWLKLVALATPAMVLDPERLLWVPGQRTFFLPSPSPIVVDDIVAYELWTGESPFRLLATFDHAPTAKEVQWVTAKDARWVWHSPDIGRIATRATNLR